MRLLIAFVLFSFPLFLFAQNQSATISGRVIDENDNSVKQASVTVLGKHTGILTNDSGYFSISVPAEKTLALVFSHNNLQTIQKNFYLSPGEKEIITVILRPEGKTLDAVVLQNDKVREETGLIKINPKNAFTLPSTTGGVESLIKTLVGSNNELTSQYSVRGGNYDENLVYINDFEIYRPYLVSNGQQEGLSLINPELTRNVQFYVGGFQAKYGDKMSSVLDIQYKKPQRTGGSVYISILEQGAHIEGNSKNKKLTYLAGVRNKSNSNVLSNQPTKGAYIPSASDAQAFLTYKISDRLQAELLGIYSISKFNFYPESVKKTASVFSPFFSMNLGLDVYFEGQEKDKYASSLTGFTLVHRPNMALNLKWMVSRFTDKENENYDIAGAYLFGERDFDRESSSFGEIVNPLGAGVYQDYARNELQIDILSLQHKGTYDFKNHFFQWGINTEFVKIDDVLKQWQYQDSAGYSLPYNPQAPSLINAFDNKANLTFNKYSGYLQDNIHFTSGKSDIILQAGLRLNYNGVNKETNISPRMQASIKPHWKHDMVFKAAAGIYVQPPFYRELRSFDGSINTGIKAQRSFQFVSGIDYNFKGPGNRPFRLTTEAYYKQMTDVVPYDIENVKIRYLGNNNAKAYTAGVDFRLFGELVEGAESWLSIGIMRSRENLDNDFYYLYKNAAGEIIDANTPDKVVADSTQQQVGWLRRPSDRLFTVGLYMEDYLPTNKNFKVHLNMLYGSNMSYNIPGSVRYRNGLIVEPYMRVDIGFSAQLLSEASQRRSHSPFRGFKNIWASLEVFNLIDRANTISYQLIKDFSNSVYAIPNRLTPRLVNLKLLARF
ncbi:MAG TPA: carboxypeptidase-like regulatory domain-containing protein [Ferruginibacter sp.]|nr:carboxypeptidase-like regulatory domain-containing protein [Ferruginibacter sp.]